MIRIVSLLLFFAAGAATLAAQSESPAPEPDPAPAKTIRRGLEIEGETTICPGSVTALKVKGEYVSYSWNTGQRTPNVTVFKPGTYEVTVVTKGGCELTGSVTVRYSSEPCL